MSYGNAGNTRIDRIKPPLPNSPDQIAAEQARRRKNDGKYTQNKLRWTPTPLWIGDGE